MIPNWVDKGNSPTHATLALQELQVARWAPKIFHIERAERDPPMAPNKITSLLLNDDVYDVYDMLLRSNRIMIIILNLLPFTSTLGHRLPVCSAAPKSPESQFLRLPCWWVPANSPHAGKPRLEAWACWMCWFDKGIPWVHPPFQGNPIGTYFNSLFFWGSKKSNHRLSPKKNLMSTLFCRFNWLNIYVRFRVEVGWFYVFSVCTRHAQASLLAVICFGHLQRAPTSFGVLLLLDFQRRRLINTYYIDTLY